MEYAIEVKDLRKSYKELKVLEGINFSVPKGKMLALLGPNGAGKTTTIRILSTLLSPDGGEIKIMGIDVARHPKKIRHLIGLTGQYAAVDEYLTGEENLIMMGELYHLGKKESVSRAKELLKQFDLEDAAGRIAKNYSGGMKRRLDLALSLVATPPVLFLDEPTTGLDPRSRIAMWEVIQRLMKDGATILLTTQYLEEADKLADKIAVIDHGKVIAEGTADELKKMVGNERLELVLKEKGDVGKAKDLAGPDAWVEPGEGNVVAVPILEVKDVQIMLEKMEKAGIKIDSISVQKPTLDDVFLKLTGHGAEAIKSEDGEIKK